MNVRHLALTLALVIGVALAAPARVLADDCPDSENPDACADVISAPDGADRGSPAATDAAVPVLDANGDAIPYVEETTDAGPLNP
jgi:hypothetical protein